MILSEDTRPLITLELDGEEASLICTMLKKVQWAHGYYGRLARTMHAGIADCDGVEGLDVEQNEKTGLFKVGEDD